MSSRSLASRTSPTLLASSSRASTRRSRAIETNHWFCAASISVIDVATELEIARAPFFDPTPAAIQVGRRHLYGTHENSGLGHVACASCHIDARMDRLAWDLGDPQGAMKPVAGQNLGANVPGLNNGFQDFHPMKGPMTTQTLQDIIGNEPLHWRGDRDGIEQFNGAFLVPPDVQVHSLEKFGKGISELVADVQQALTSDGFWLLV